jgi:hypothetical protein
VVTVHDDGLQVDIFGASVPVARVGDVDAPRPPRRTRGECQRQAVLDGKHPLTGAAVNVRAPADATDANAVGLRCGSCSFLVKRVGGNGRTYLKCSARGGKHLTNSAATDVRTWWPACPSHTPRPKEEPR